MASPAHAATLVYVGNTGLHCEGAEAQSAAVRARLLGALGRGRLAPRASAIGAVHGMAGSAAVSLLVLATFTSTWSAARYLVVFGLGTLAGMTAFTAAMALPVSTALRFTLARRALALGTSLGSIVFGLVDAWRVV